MRYKKSFVILLSFFLTLVLFSSIPSKVLGADIRVGKDREDVTVDQYIDDDLYVSGQRIVVNDDVSGDLFAAGGEILINDDIYGDALVIGGSVTIKGNIRGSITAVGGLILIEGDVEEDVTVFSGDLKLSGSVKDDVRFNGGTYTITSLEIGDDLLVNAGSGSIDDTTEVGGDKQITVGQSPGELRSYFSDKVLSLGSFNFVSAMMKFLKNVGVIIGWIIVGMILLKLLPEQSKKVVDTIAQRELLAKSTLYGLVAVLSLLLLLPILFGFSLIGVGKPFFSIFTFASGLIVSISGMLGAWGIAKLLLEIITKRKSDRYIWSLVAGVFIYSSLALFSFICCVGCLSYMMKAAFSIIGIGGMILSLRKT